MTGLLFIMVLCLAMRSINASCNGNNCLNALHRNKDSNSFCLNYLSLAGQPIPNYLANCHDSPSRVSSACFCYSPTPTAICSTALSSTVSISSASASITSTTLFACPASCSVSTASASTVTVTITDTLPPTCPSLSPSSIVIYTCSTTDYSSASPTLPSSNLSAAPSSAALSSTSSIASASASPTSSSSPTSTPVSIPPNFSLLGANSNTSADGQVVDGELADDYFLGFDLPYGETNLTFGIDPISQYLYINGSNNVIYVIWAINFPGGDPPMLVSLLPGDYSGYTQWPVVCTVAPTLQLSCVAQGMDTYNIFYLVDENQDGHFELAIGDYAATVNVKGPVDLFVQP
ncbi:uncharacterized protein LY89DRAFT_787492 [Mollisia scopiformis]|uniref:Uncharacterized protein n=1 Tax=Mollisia scopiformis TaxID=149040 RepID=A0A132BDZ8_MOLSC|nr:uncharacterized protein LY89DRAFT_787492 [Mollisia scopiformis]KUJ10473.1 hypothetical protein LY89DRAFT_787492 [Mollisia scopiformis]